MEELKTLVKRLLGTEPTYVFKGPFDDLYVSYINGKYEYSIHLEGNNTIILNLYENDPYKYLNTFTIEATEREYMEIKWEIEELKKLSDEKQIDGFKEFVDGLSKNTMDELLNE